MPRKKIIVPPCIYYHSESDYTIDNMHEIPCMFLFVLTNTLILRFYSICVKLLKEVIIMPLRWRVDPLPFLKEKGYSSYRIRKENLFNQSSMKCLRYKQPVSWKDLEKLCELTGVNIGKLIEYVKKTD